MKIAVFCAVVLFLSLAGSSAVLARQTDYTCMRDCQNAGYLYGFCQSQCSFDTGVDNNSLMGGSGGGILPDTRSRPSRTDYNCMSDCQGMGYQYRYCKDLCSY